MVRKGVDVVALCAACASLFCVFGREIVKRSTARMIIRERLLVRGAGVNAYGDM
jgi:hypothetical protein